MIYALVNDSGRQTWCGPAAVSIIVGEPMSAVVAAIRKYKYAVGDRSPLKGTRFAELQAALIHFGHDAYASENEHISRVGEIDKHKSLARWARERRNASETNLVMLASHRGAHWLVVEADVFADSATPRPTPLMKCPYRRRRVNMVWRVL